MLCKVSLTFLLACTANGQPPSFDTSTLQVNEQLVQVEIADTYETRQYGLMFREHLPTNQGMWFEFDYAQTQCMWMKNTLIDLDVAFVDEQFEIVNVQAMQAGSTNIHCSDGPARYALEMNQGWFQANQVQPGDQVRLLKGPK